NGKGTVTHIVSAILQSMGLTVGIYTSPHYVDFRERIKVNGQLVSEDYIIDWVESHRSLMTDIQPSFFEVTVAMAFDYFKSEEVDIAIIETGLGGRLDSTNIISPILSVITHISLDHQSMLGETIYEIAGEKAGIIKSRTPVVIGRYQSSCDQVFMEKAASQKSTVEWASLNWQATKIEDSFHILSRNHEITIGWHPGQSPFFQENIITALETIESYARIEEVPWNQNAINLGIEKYRSITNYIGRWQILQEDPLMIADSAHNEDALGKVLEKVVVLNKKIHFVIGFVRDKDLDKVLALFPKEASYYFVNANIERAIPSDQVANNAKQYGLSGDSYNSVIKGITAAKMKAKANEMIYIGGSSFVVGDALEALH
ncbi:MAG: dihydrofolate synthase/folylpolyglutamate synthase, partial [Saprospiraceae bacterium]